GLGAVGAAAEAVGSPERVCDGRLGRAPGAAGPCVPLGALGQPGQDPGEALDDVGGDRGTFGHGSSVAPVTDTPPAPGRPQRSHEPELPCPDAGLEAGPGAEGLHELGDAAAVGADAEAEGAG